MKITNVRKNTDGDITAVKLDNNQEVNIQEAISMTEEGKIEGVNVSYAKNGRSYLRSNPNGVQQDNLDQMPTF
ncbi:DUF3892 domain-containing protein [Oceanirhabdus seepicola]|uniref:DUF3892 domain-containing protein n=1 Tax=Oceanirhabdus seepicola TaxID=2828781 RepID=A0A9J6P4I5_9CLOT|nr:DUF3892 domain-containing protein [Oceanirhabdus seepicola]MCM1991682.1 DUF3892 domain-containing protein [Oceanirhabdus seepicola]